MVIGAWARAAKGAAQTAAVRARPIHESRISFLLVAGIPVPRLLSS